MNRTGIIKKTSPLDEYRLRLYHNRYGDLSSPDSVSMEPHISKYYPCKINPLTYIHLSVTGKCYARCKGCVNAAITSSFPGDRRDIVPISDTIPERDASCIMALIKKQGPSPVVICFYGGEPLLETQKIDAVYRLIEQAHLQNPISYMIYTNGDLLKKAVTEYPDLLADIWLFSLSIDGGREQHDRTRLGTSLARIHEGLRALKKIRTGKVLMWSTLREDQSLLDCYNEFFQLLEKGYADQFFWHWIETAEPYVQLDTYAAGYENDLAAIMDVYTQWLEKGDILPIVHINELVVYFLAGIKRNSSACGVELAKNFDLIDGKVHSCADLPTELAIGTIDDFGIPHFHKKDLTFLVEYKKDLGCFSCKVHDYCGGRCPVQAYSRGQERLSQYCQLMRLHIGCVKEYLGRIVAAMDKNDISVQDLYDASAFYAQLTDVTP